MLFPLPPQMGGAELVRVSGEDAEAQGGIAERERVGWGGSELHGPAPGLRLSSWPPATRGWRRHECSPPAGGSRSIYQPPLHTPGKARGQGSGLHLARVCVRKHPGAWCPGQVTAPPLTGPQPRAATHPLRRRFLTSNVGRHADLTQWSRLTAEADPQVPPAPRSVNTSGPPVRCPLTSRLTSTMAPSSLAVGPPPWPCTPQKCLCDDATSKRARLCPQESGPLPTVFLSYLPVSSSLSSWGK